MNYYFRLQFKLINRQLIAFGVLPIVAYVLIALLFVVFSFYIFKDPSLYNAYIYAAVALINISQLSKKKRQDFLKLIFPQQDFRQVRFLENSLLTCPFFLVLLIQQAWVAAIVLLVFSLLLTRVTIHAVSSVTIPTPFAKYPFEFISGFRRTFFVYFFAYFLLVMGIYEQQINVCGFALIISLLPCLSFYSEVETPFYVWTNARTAREFLFYKLIRGLLLAAFLSFPISISTLYFFPDQWKIPLGIQILGLLYLLVAILGKYTSFPRKMQLPNGLMFGFSLLMPPFLLLLIPFFYVQSIRRLAPLLDRNTVHSIPEHHED